MYIIEKYGYLTDSENDNLILDLKKSGFDINNIEIESPNKHTTYGELIYFTIKYKIRYMMPTFAGNFSDEMIEIVVKKSSYCKI